MKVHFDTTTGTTELVITPEYDGELAALSLFKQLNEDEHVADVYHNIVLLTDKE